MGAFMVEPMVQSLTTDLMVLGLTMDPMGEPMVLGLTMDPMGELIVLVPLARDHMVPEVMAEPA
jgi:hypothetical protein